MAKQMKAAVYDAFGGAAKVQVKTLDVPELQEGEVLVRIKAAAVNPVDSAVREGYLKDFLPYEFPVIPGWDVAGVVEERGFSARRFAVGDEVYAYARRPLVKYGTYAEYIVLPESYLSRKPQNLSFEETAGIPLVGLTAYQSLFDAGKLQQGQSVLILGASGGVGTIAIQLAKEKGATVIGVASEKNHSYMKELGADHTITYKDTHIGDSVKEVLPEGVDLIFDCASGETLEQALSALKPSGKLVSILNQGQDLDKSIDFAYVFVEPNSSQLDRLRELAEAGKLKVHVSETYKLQETAEAMRQIETKHTTGKIVIVP
ncbi:NADP-dependent oxidoreductase [Pontibacter akesuensis]|uniref:NADPH:quinone reductase n=1 Tax=Pontibacter akesuensis TaxID=388950 RepID=A0A1I7KTZ4_9BACT|nr:NADP-dependent oxidoreductase [Pontibacter akesuensis]GHA80628.1 NADPH:quinone reductase [Pontibacter akesuensis]SFV00858.1 NADPH:quinone reductase [Pontibacter akesuensis]